MPKKQSIVLLVVLATAVLSLRGINIELVDAQGLPYGVLYLNAVQAVEYPPIFVTSPILFGFRVDGLPSNYTSFKAVLSYASSVEQTTSVDMLLTFCILEPCEPYMFSIRLDLPPSTYQASVELFMLDSSNNNQVVSYTSVPRVTFNVMGSTIATTIATTLLPATTTLPATTIVTIVTTNQWSQTITTTSAYTYQSSPTPSCPEDYRWNPPTRTCVPVTPIERVWEQIQRFFIWLQCLFGRCPTPIAP